MFSPLRRVGGAILTALFGGLSVAFDVKNVASEWSWTYTAYAAFIFSLGLLASSTYEYAVEARKTRLPRFEVTGMLWDQVAWFWKKDFLPSCSLPWSSGIVALSLRPDMKVTLMDVTFEVQIKVRTPSTAFGLLHKWTEPKTKEMAPAFERFQYVTGMNNDGVEQFVQLPVVRVSRHEVCTTQPLTPIQILPDTRLGLKVVVEGKGDGF